ncbi:MarR family winged helix-turn-helix transcriptional regulator [Achromobacter aloeverae]|uniref:MarR family transcriptional regulator n=1 Tax=Achromobacter aloeverae TaxID=1750518 RepID=A0A4Q1HR95_9BURK|nr:MarR family transcriptional regulator [Achromobacter aloeverae]RXN93509.1 MarR family transcriptional regulator [Achromobacter aloeverae]
MNKLPLPVDQADYVDHILSQWCTARPDLPIAPMAVFSRLFRLQAVASRDIDRSLRPLGVNPGEFDVIATLTRHGPPHALSPQQLAESLLLSSGAMTNRLDRLEQAGLVARQPNPDDRRGIIVTLTELGRQTADAVLRAYLDILDRMLAPLAPDRREALAGLLRELLLAHDRHAPGAIKP